MKLQKHLTGDLGWKSFVGFRLFELMKDGRVIKVDVLENARLPNIVLARFQRFFEARAISSVARKCG
jgi:hypothetical protein